MYDIYLKKSINKFNQKKVKKVSEKLLAEKVYEIIHN